LTLATIYDIIISKSRRIRNMVKQYKVWFKVGNEIEFFIVVSATNSEYAEEEACLMVDQNLECVDVEEIEEC
jgi:hypothetical protein